MLTRLQGQAGRWLGRGVIVALFVLLPVVVYRTAVGAMATATLDAGIARLTWWMLIVTLLIGVFGAIQVWRGLDQEP